MKRLVIALVFILGTCTVASAEERQGITLEEAVNIAIKEVPGKVIEAEFENGIYEVKIRTESGERIKFRIDPKDGTILRKGKIVKSSSKGFGKPEDK